jgi:hypothetical protein
MPPENVILVYGAGGVGKSTLAAMLAAHTFKGTGKKTRVVGADGGGTKAFQALINRGIVEYWPVDQWGEQSIFQVLDLATKGWWPEDPLSSNSPINPPTKEWYQCPLCEGNTGASRASGVAKCNSCKKEIPLGVRPKRITEYIGDFENVGAVVFEGVTAFGLRLLARLRKVDPAGGNTIKDDGFDISNPGLQHFGNAQTYLEQFISNSRQIPVKTVLWTALELRGTDDQNSPVFGPAFPGKKLTTLCVPWFTDVFHIDTESKGKDDKGNEKTERAIFLTKHFPADTKPYGFVAKSSAPLGGGMPNTIPYTADTNAISTYFSLLDLAYKNSGDKLLA